MNYSNQLKVLRESFGISQREIGKLLGVPQTTYSNYETGIREIPEQIIERLLNIGLDLNWFGSGYLDEKLLMEVSSRIQESRYNKRLDELAELMGSNVEFLKAIIDLRVMPSPDFINRLGSVLFKVFHVSTPEQSAVKEKPESYGENELDKLKGKVELLQAMYDKCNEENLDLKIEIKHLKELLKKPE